MKKILIALAMVFSFAVLVPVSSAVALFEDAKNEACAGSKAEESATCDTGPDKINNIIRIVIQIFSVVVGIVAVIMLVMSGFRFVTSQGDPGNIAKARSSLIYALVGLVVVALAQATIKFVLASALQPPPAPPVQCNNDKDDDEDNTIDYDGDSTRSADPDCNDEFDNSE